MITRYTNIVLTIIALALVTIAVQDLNAPVSAQSGSVQRVVICDSANTLHCASLAQMSQFQQDKYLLAVRSVQ